MPLDSIPKSSIAVLITALVVLVVVATRQAGPRTIRRLDVLRGLAWRALDPMARRRGRPLTRDKTDSDEFVVTVDASLLQLLRVLLAHGWVWNPLSTKKSRVVDGQAQWAVASVVLRDGLAADRQLHAYVFANANGTLDVYAHEEDSVVRINDHQDASNQVAGDPEGVLRGHLHDAGLLE